MVCPLLCVRSRRYLSSALPIVAVLVLADSDPPSSGWCVSPLPLPNLLCQTLGPYNNFLKAAHVNAQSLICHMDEFKSIFSNSLFDIILVSETWLKPYISDRSVSLHDYSLYRNDRLHKGGGGVAIYAKSHLPVSVLHLSDTSRDGFPEFLFLDVSVSGIHVLVSVCYRAPRLRNLQEFEGILIDLMARYSHVMVMGDLNTDLLGPITYDQTYLTTMFTSCNMTVLPLDATHHTANTDTWLDVMAVSDATQVPHHGQFPVPGLSRHDLVYLVYNIRPPSIRPKLVRFRNYRSFNLNDLLSDASVLPWHDVLSSDNVDMMVYKFNKLLICLYDKHAPFVTKRVTRAPVPWMTPHIKQLQKQRDSAYRRAKRSKSIPDWEHYKRLRNHTQQQIRNAKVRFYYSTLSRKQSTKSLWSKIKDLGIGKTNSYDPISIELNTINDFFTNIPIDSSEALDYANALETQATLDPVRQCLFSPVDETDVSNSIMRMSSNAVGADEIPIRFVKETLPITLPIITAIFNESLTSFTFPQIWKSAVVRPLPKCSNPTSPSEFRPISILPALSKCLERIVHSQFSTFLKTNNILSSFQSGFRQSHSTTTALLKITDDIRLAMDSRQVTILTLFDFSKAFDCVYHPLLLTKLKLDGFSEGCVNWVKSYLSDRRQRVSSGTMESDWRPVTRGVPQGSVLGPLFFSLYINSITKDIVHSRCHLYADDLQMYYHFSPKDIDNAITLINTDINSITLWAKRHGLKLNETKTQTIIIGHPRLTSRIDLQSAPKLIVNNTALDYCDKVKNLGLTINKSLTWHETVTTTCNRVFASIHSLKRVALFLPFNIKVMLVKTLVLPHFNYCDVVTNDMTVELADRLQRAQNYCIRFIFNLRKYDHVSPYFEHVNLLKLDKVRKYHILTLLHAVVGLASPRYLSEKFTFLSQINNRTTRRGELLLTIPLHRSAVYDKSFTVTACRLWNSLPDNIKRIESRARFGAEVREWLVRG